MKGDKLATEVWPPFVAGGRLGRLVRRLHGAVTCDHNKGAHSENEAHVVVVVVAKTFHMRRRAIDYGGLEGLP